MSHEAPLETTPVTILTGFLGSGKTTLLNRILTGNHGKKIAVILNEIGEVNLDSELVVESQGEDLKVMNNGCLCCTVRGDLTKICQELKESRGGTFDYLVIETTGMADPSPVAQTFFMDETLQQQYHLDSIVTIVDALHIERNLKELKETAEQIAFADVVVINKKELVSVGQLDDVRKKIKAINSVAQVFETDHCAVPLDAVIGVGAFDLTLRTELNPHLLHDFHEHDHDQAIKSIYLEEKRPLDINKLNKFMSLVIGELGEQMLRSKGVVSIKGDPMRTVFQSVHMTIGAAPDRFWSDTEERKTQMVFIGRHLPKDVLAEGLSLCVAD